MSNTNHAYEELMLAEARADVGAADQKASILLAGIGVGAGALLGGLLAGDWSPFDLTGLSALSWWIASMALLGAAVLAGLAVWPRFKTDDGSARIFFWGHVVRYKTELEFARAMAGSPPSAATRTRHQLYRLSHVVHTKYRLVRASLICLAGAVATYLLSAVTA